MEYTALVGAGQAEEPLSVVVILLAGSGRKPYSGGRRRSLRHSRRSLMGAASVAGGECAWEHECVPRTSAKKSRTDETTLKAKTILLATLQ